MPEFVNPFPGNVPREMTHGELVRAVMLDMAAELEAVHLYYAHMEATTNEDAKKVFYDIALEELAHVGEFSSLLYRLDPEAGVKAREGFEEVRELLGSHAPFTVSSVEVVTQSAPAASAAAEAETAPTAAPGLDTLTVGSLKGE